MCRRVSLVLVLLIIMTAGLYAFEIDDFSVEGGLPLLFPLGEYSNLSSFSSGPELIVMASPFDSEGLPDLGIFGDMQILFNATTVEDTKLSNLGFAGGAEYSFNEIGGVQALSLSAQLGLGGYIHFASGSWNAQATEAMVFFDSFALISAAAHWSFGKAGSLILRLRYHLFLESESTGHLFGPQISYRYDFKEIMGK